MQPDSFLLDSIAGLFVGAEGAQKGCLDPGDRSLECPHFLRRLEPQLAVRAPIFRFGVSWVLPDFHAYEVVKYGGS